jgi:hypothetical protein
MTYSGQPPEANKKEIYQVLSKGTTTRTIKARWCFLRRPGATYPKQITDWINANDIREGELIWTQRYSKIQLETINGEVSVRGLGNYTPPALGYAGNWTCEKATQDPHSGSAVHQLVRLSSHTDTIGRIQDLDHLRHFSNFGPGASGWIEDRLKMVKKGR